MRIIIDLQGAQTESRFRGIGRYSLSLALAIAKNPGTHEIWLALNSAFPESAVEIRREFEGLIPAERIRLFSTPTPVAEYNTANSSLARIAEKIREQFITQLNPDMVLVSSLFEGYVDNATTSIGSFTSSKNTAVILYDLIPLINPDQYLSATTQKHYYHHKIESLKNAGLLLAISDYSKNSAIDLLNLDSKNVTNISTATEPCFQKKNITIEEKTKLLNRYAITKKIILCVSGGFDARKNVNGLLTAYSLLSKEIRNTHQLIIASKINVEYRDGIEKLRKKLHIGQDELILTDYISNDDLIILYNLAELFVFPSLLEGFGLPVLEAMACGVPVIGSNSTSVPEVINFDEALFDPNSPQSIADKIAQVINDEGFRLRLQNHGLKQATQFSWEKSAEKALTALENYFARISTQTNTLPITKKPKLAFISPLPPERTGIADYSAELLSELTKHYDIELITHQVKVNLPAELSHLPIYSAEWFKENAKSYARVLYQFGNSPFHTHMLELLRNHPGAVMLHDFYMSSMLAYEEITGNIPHVWTKALFHSHGYAAIQSRFTKQTDETKNQYPCNLEILQNALGVMVHSKYSKQLANKWYQENAAANWNVIPLLRIPVTNSNKTAARKSLNIDDNAFVICSFGLVDPTKLSHRLLKAWLSSRLSKDLNCHLVFVGINHGGDYGQNIINTININQCQDRARVTGWTEKEVYEQYLQAADVGVQLRTMSRGETSAAALDCMNYGLATIVNANGSMAELPTNATLMLNDEFQDDELISALEKLWQDEQYRAQLAENAHAHIITKHSPVSCASQYANIIEEIYQQQTIHSSALIKAIALAQDDHHTKINIERISQAIANSNRPQPTQKQLLIDVTTIVRTDLKTGIERVVRSQLLELIKNPPHGFSIEPIYLSNELGKWHYRYARQYMCKILGITQLQGLIDPPIDISQEDIFYAADFAPYEITQAAQAGLFTEWQALGVKINFLVYDLLPILQPQFFPAGANNTHKAWLSEVVKFADRVIGISHAVADEIRHWLEKEYANQNSLRHTPLKISAAPLGADLNASAPTLGLPNGANELLTKLKSKPSFLMVGTIEPRKGYLQTIDAFTQLWQQGHDIQLIIVGKEGWKPLAENERRTIPEIIKKINIHPELGSRLIWIENASDEYLEKIYQSSSCLIAASEGEGFGLPLIEAAQYGLPIIARDIPVFREVAQQHAHYFNGLEYCDLASEITTWLNLYSKKQIISSKEIKWNTWSDHTEQLISVVLDKTNDRLWVSETIRQKALDEHLNFIHAARIDLVTNYLPKGAKILDLGGANSPLHKMGYPHQFDKLTLIDLPPDERHEYYKDIVVDSSSTYGQVVVRYTDMTKLEDIEDHSVDFVWSGQSIEHVPHEAGERMCHEAYRVLKKGGSFCLDTPNRLLTEIHTRHYGGGFIHPEHYIEYIPEQLKDMLLSAGFTIKAALGICEMQETVATNDFHYADFMFGKKITENINDGYIQFFHCVKI